jgi:hypothetical protein
MWGANWCNSTIEFMSAYAEAAKRVGIRAYYVDGEFNDVEGHSVTSFPLIKLQRKGKFIEYEGDLTLKAFVKFLRSFSNDEL